MATDPKMREFLKAMGRMQEQDYVTAEEFNKLFQAVLDAVKSSAIKNGDKIEEINKVADKKAKELESYFMQIVTAIDARMKQVKDGDKGEDGRTPVAGVDYPDYTEIRSFIKEAIADLPKPKDASETVTVDYIKDALISLEGHDRLPHTAIDGIKEYISEQVSLLESNLRRGPIFVGGGGTTGTGTTGGGGATSPLTTKGDLWTYSSADARLGVGADGTVLTADASTATGLKWAVPAGGGDVAKVGTPVDGQVGVWTGDGTIEGDTALTFDTTTDTLSSGGFIATGLTASELVATDANKKLQSLAVATYPSLTELSYLKGTTSAIQTQFNAKQATLSGATLTGATIAVDDKVLIQDTNDSNNLKTVTTQAVANLATPEGTAIKSTGEAGGTKFLREDGDGTCSWQTVVVPTRDSLGLDTDDSPQFAGINLGHATDTTIARVSAGVASIEGNNIITANRTASDSQTGIVELATTAETNTGTSTSLAVTPDGLAGSVHGTKSVCVQVFDGTTDVTVGDGKAYIVVPEALNGMDVIRATARVITAGTTNATTIDIYNVTDSVDILSTAISIASGGTLATAGTVNTSNDSLATNDLLRIDVTSVSTTAPKGLVVVIEARLP
jgi:hypothetical protein